MLSVIRARLPRWLKILAVIYVAYLTLVLLVATPLLNWLAPRIYRAQTGAELKLDKVIWLNPFTLSVTARAASSANADGSPFWSFDELYANLSLASVWRGHPVLDAVALRGLDLQIDQTAPDRFNFSEILDYRATRAAARPDTTAPPDTASPTTKDAAAAGGALPAIEIEQFDFSAKHLGYRAPYAGEPVDVTLTDAGLKLANFSALPPPPRDTAKDTPDKPADTDAQPAAAMPSLRGDHVDLAIAGIAVDFLRKQRPFQAALRGLQIAAPTLATTADSAYTLGVQDAAGGRLDIAGNLALSHASTTGKAQLRGVDLVPVWQYLANRVAFTTRSAQLDGDVDYRVSWSPTLVYQVTDSRLALRDVQLQARDDSDTSAAFSALRVAGIGVDSTQTQAHIASITLEKPVLRGWNRDAQVSLTAMFAVATSDEPSSSTPSPWHAAIDTIDIADGGVRWRASQLDDHTLALAALTLHATNLHWPDATPLQFNASTRITSATDTGASAKTTPNDNRGNTANTAKVSLTGELVPSTATGKVDASIGGLPLAWANPLVTRQMRASIAGGALDTKLELKLDNAQLTTVNSDGHIDDFELLAQADKRKLAAWRRLQWQRLAVELPQQRIKLQRLLVAEPWVQFRINTDGTNNFQQLLTTAPADTATAAASKPATSSAAAPALAPSPSSTGRAKQTGKPWRFALTTMRVDKATIDFRDASLNSAFRTNITELSGDIDDLESGARGEHPAKVGLHGTVDGYAPVALTGTVDPFATKPTLDVTLDMTNLDLATLTPYSGTYAGYQIDGGRLTVQLAYTLENDRIKGTNHIVVNQMQLGKQVSGPKVMDLPLRFAIYLLTDANGVLDLGVDVTGDVDDPDFSVGSIIWKAFRNLIVKTATSPFRALAHLVGAGGDNFDRVSFAPGSAAVDANQSKKLAKLGEALKEKSKLKLSISGHISPSQDIEALRDEQLSATLIERDGITRADIHEQSKHWQSAVVDLFKKRFPAEDTSHWQVMQMNDAMRDNEELPASALSQLAAQRALAVKQALVTNFGLPADRAYLKPVDLGADKHPGLLATLQVE